MVYSESRDVSSAEASGWTNAPKGWWRREFRLWGLLGACYLAAHMVGGWL